jgi:hypothetical protein
MNGSRSVIVGQNTTIRRPSSRFLVTIQSNPLNFSSWELSKMSKNFVLSFFLVIFGVTPAYATDLCQDGEIKIEPTECGYSLSIGGTLIGKCLKKNSPAFKSIMQLCKDMPQPKGIGGSAGDVCIGKIWTETSQNLFENGAVKKVQGVYVKIGTPGTVDQYGFEITKSRLTKEADVSKIDKDIRSYCEAARAGSRESTTKKSGSS